jgi:peptidoglycan hydrolase CwlO-like protein
MIETSPRLSESAVHDNEHEDHMRSEASFGVRAACCVLGLATLVLAYMVYEENSTVADTGTQLAQATDQGLQTKADLDKANIRVADMQNQVTAATAKASDLQTQLAKAQGQNTDLQAQIAKANSQVSEMKTQVDSAKERLSEAQAKISLANDDSALLRKELDAAKAQVADFQSQDAKAQATADSTATQAAAPLPAMPVAAKFVKSSWTGGFTLHVKNTNSGPLIVTITVEGSQGRAPIPAIIEGGSTFDVKDLASGTNVVLTSNGFSPVNLTVR